MKKVIISGMVGNALEWYDYALYIQFAYIIGMHFLPKELASDIRDIITLIIFASGFIIRPIGGILLGMIGDKVGRKTALVIGILAMALPTAGLGLLPSYNTIGIFAPIILIIFRLIQGFAIGGEFSGCIAYIVEHSEKSHRGLVGSTSFSSMCIGMLLGVLTAKFCTFIMTEEFLYSFGWRIPFVAGLFIGFIGLYIRSHLSESPIYKHAKDSGYLSRTPLRETIYKYYKPLLIAIGIYVTVTAPFYTITVFIENFMNSIGYSKYESSNVCAVILLVLSISFPIFAHISDKIGRKPILFIGIILIFISSYKIIEIVNGLDYTYTLLSQIYFAIIVGLYMSCVPTVLVELFPTKVRFTGIALSYNLSAAIFGGSTPAIGRILSKFTGNNCAIAYYLMTLAVVSFITIIFFKETYQIDLAD